MIFMENMEKAVKSVDKKVEKFTDILVKFGLNLIQTLGKTNHQLGILTEKIEKMEKDLMDVKGFGPKFQEISKLRMEFQAENKNVRAQLTNLANKLEFGLPPQDFRQSNELGSQSQSESKSKLQSPLELLEEFKTQVKEAQTKGDLNQFISSVREQLYILTGGHKILMELRTFEHKLQSIENYEASKADFQSNLVKKIADWQNLF